MSGKQRLVREGEKPVFGSVWTWGQDMAYVRLMALCRDATGDLVFIDLQAGSVSDNWSFYPNGQPADPAMAWYCVDEGPAGMPRV